MMTLESYPPRKAVPSAAASLSSGDPASLIGFDYESDFDFGFKVTAANVAAVAIHALDYNRASPSKASPTSGTSDGAFDADAAGFSASTEVLHAVIENLAHVLSAAAHRLKQYEQQDQPRTNADAPRDAPAKEGKGKKSVVSESIHQNPDEEEEMVHVGAILEARDFFRAGMETHPIEHIRVRLQDRLRAICEADLAPYAKSLCQIPNLLAMCGMRLVDTPKLGNCQFHAAIEGLWQVELKELYRRATRWNADPADVKELHIFVETVAGLKRGIAGSAMLRSEEQYDDEFMLGLLAEVNQTMCEPSGCEKTDRAINRERFLSYFKAIASNESGMGVEVPNKEWGNQFSLLQACKVLARPIYLLSPRNSAVVNFMRLAPEDPNGPASMFKSTRETSAHSFKEWTQWLLADVEAAESDTSLMPLVLVLHHNHYSAAIVDTKTSPPVLVKLAEASVSVAVAIKPEPAPRKQANTTTTRSPSLLPRPVPMNKPVEKPPSCTGTGRGLSRLSTVASTSTGTSSASRKSVGTTGSASVTTRLTKPLGNETTRAMLTDTQRSQDRKPKISSRVQAAVAATTIIQRPAWQSSTASIYPVAMKGKAPFVPMASRTTVARATSTPDLPRKRTRPTASVSARAPPPVRGKAKANIVTSTTTSKTTPQIPIPRVSSSPLVSRSPHKPLERPLDRGSMTSQAVSVMHAQSSRATKAHAKKQLTLTRPRWT